jgi:hypothetical protein
MLQASLGHMHMHCSDRPSLQLQYGGVSAGIKSRIYPNAPAGFSYPGDPGFNGDASTTTEWKDFQRRLGFAWDLFEDGKTAIRGGAGIAYDFFNLQLHHNDDTAAPFGGRVELAGVNFSSPWADYPGGDSSPTPSASVTRFSQLLRPISLFPQICSRRRFNSGTWEFRGNLNHWFATAT